MNHADKPDRHAHGTAARYCHGPAGDGVDPCRCRPCLDAMMAAQNTRRASGRTAHVDAEPVRAHLEQLRAAGLSITRIGRRAGISYRTVANVWYGQPCSNRPPPAQVRRATAHKILAVALPARNVGWYRPADRSVGRLRALVARGWSVRLLAAHLELDNAHVSKLIRGDKPTVTAATEYAVITLHKQLWPQQPPQATRHERAAVTRALERARREGWALPARRDAAERGAA